jgi:hypothetical protein
MLASESAANGVYVYAALFNNGTVDSAVDYNLSLVANGDTLDGGKLYIVVRSVDQADTASLSIADSLASESFINAGSATAYDFSYDSFEVTLDGTSTDAANLTSVNGLASPMELSVDNHGTTSSVGYNIPGRSIVSDVVANAGTEVESYFTAGGLGTSGTIFRTLTSLTVTGPALAKLRAQLTATGVAAAA